jgi:NitT/TauT family transport system substrate-binding protein
VPAPPSRVPLGVGLALLGLLALGDPGASRAAAETVRLQLKWVPQAQFAGYYAAQAQGYYAAESLEVTLLPGGPDLVPEDVVARGGAELGIGWLPSLLTAIERGPPLVNIAQIYARSGMRELAFKSSGIRSVADLRGRRVSVWPGGHEGPLLATLEKYGIDRTRDVTLVPQGLGMAPFLDKKVDAAAAMTYNEYRQVLDAGVKPDELTVIDFDAEGTAMLEDGLFTRTDWLGRHQEVAARFLRASLRGWTFCRDRVDECADIVLRHNPALVRSHQVWMMAEVNRLIWGPPAPPSPLGKMDPAAFDRTAAIARRFGVLKRPADRAAYTHEIWELATRK